MARPLVEPIFRDQFFLVFIAGMARDIRSKKPVPAKPWKKLISAEKMNFNAAAHPTDFIGGARQRVFLESQIGS